MYETWGAFWKAAALGAVCWVALFLLFLLISGWRV